MKRRMSKLVLVVVMAIIIFTTFSIPVFAKNAEEGMIEEGAVDEQVATDDIDDYCESVEIQQIDATPTGKTEADAIPVTFGKNGTLSWIKNNENSYRYLYLNVEKTGVVSIDISNPFNSENQGFYICMYDKAHNPFWQGVGCGENAQEGGIVSTCKWRVALRPGEYYLIIGPGLEKIENGITITYQVRFSENNFYEADPNNSMYDATNITLGKKYTGFMYGGDVYKDGHFYTDYDYFKFSTQKGHRYKLVLTGNASRYIDICATLSMSDLSVNLKEYCVDGTAIYEFVASKAEDCYVCITDYVGSYSLLIEGTEYPVNTWKKDNRGWKYYNNNGKAIDGWMIIDGKRYYFVDEYMMTGWQKVDMLWKYYADGDLLYLNEYNWFYFGSNGELREGWKKINNKWYFFENREDKITSIKKYNGYTMVGLYNRGVMLTGWQEINGKWYFFGTDGAMKLDWQKYNGKWYYFGTDGTMKSGWQEYDGKWYYFGTDGTMKTGWKKIGGKWYYFETSGSMAANKWINDTYYVKANGVMATNEWIGNYYVGADGKYVPGKKK